MTNISDARVLGGKALEAAKRYSKLVRETTDTLNAASREFIALRNRLALEQLAGHTEMMQVVSEETGFTIEELEEWTVLYGISEILNVAYMIKPEKTEPLSTDPKKSLN